MKKKMWAVMLAAVVAAATVGVASPAQAQSWPFECLEREGQFGLHTVSVDLQTFEIRIDPAGVDDDVNYIAAVTTGLALCLENGYVVGPVTCLYTKLNEILRSISVVRLYFRYVYQDPYTGEIVVDGGQLLDDAGACVGMVNLG